MKSLEVILKQTPVYLNDWKEQGGFGVISDFEDLYISKEEYESIKTSNSSNEYLLDKKEKIDQTLENQWKGINILFASYGYANYSGDAWVLFEQCGKLYEVNGSHCSCYGLEGQWTPEEIVLEELENRLLKGSFGEDNWSDNNFKEQLCDFLGVEFVRNLEEY